MGKVWVSSYLMALALMAGSGCSTKLNWSNFISTASFQVNSISPTVGPPSGNLLVTVTGLGFTAAVNSVNIGGLPCTPITILSATQLTCTTPALAAGSSYNLDVSDSLGQSGSLPLSFQVVTGPMVLSVSPSGGPLSGSTLINVNGFGFLAGASITVGGSACTGATFNSSMSYTCLVPAGGSLGPVNVVLTNTDTTTSTLTSGYTYANAPTFTSISPASGFASGGTAVTITGTGFFTGATVDLGGSSCTPAVVMSSTTITCTTSIHSAALTSITITNPDTQNVTVAGAYTYVAAPTLSGVSPAFGTTSGLTAITVTGTNFASGAVITLGGTVCATGFVNSTTLTCNTPAHAAGLVNLVVTNPDTQSVSLTNAYSYNAAPTISSVTPSIGSSSGGTTITIIGSGFLNTPTLPSITVAGSACGTVTYTSATQVSCSTPAHAIGGPFDVVLTNYDGQSATKTASYSYTTSPTLSSVSPVSGPLAGGTTLTINGSNFISGATVTVGGNTCTSPTVSTSILMTCTLPSSATGLAADIVVTNPGPMPGTLVGGYTYIPAPTFTSILPSGGVLTGGTSVTINGTGFLAGAVVTLGGSTCTPVSLTSTQIQCTTPPHAIGAVNVVITNTDSQTVNATNAYTYVITPVFTSISVTLAATANAGDCMPITVTPLDQTSSLMASASDTYDFSVTAGTGHFFPSLYECQYGSPHSFGSARPLKVSQVGSTGTLSGLYFRPESAQNPVTVRVTPTLVPAQSKNVNVSTGIAASYLHRVPTAASQIVATPLTGIVANGTSTATITVQLNDEYGNPLKNQALTLASSPGSNLASPSLTTNALGIASTTLTATSIGAVSVWLVTPYLSALTTRANIPATPPSTSRITIASAPRSPTSWIVNSTPLAITMSLSPALSGAETLVCRFQKAGSLTAFVPCDGGPGTGLTFTPPNPGAGVNEGIFYFEAAVLDGSMTSTITRPFYLHTSLQNKNDCTFFHTPAQYFSVASAALGTPSGLFAPINPFELPVVNYNLDLVYFNSARNRTESQEARSLRKDFFVDATNKFILIRRHFPSDLNNCTTPMQKKDPNGTSSPFKPFHRSQTHCDGIVISKSGSAVCLIDSVGAVTVARFAETVRWNPFKRTTTNRYPFYPKATSGDQNATIYPASVPPIGLPD